MSNFSEIIHVESLRKQLLNKIEVLDAQIANLNKSVKQKGLEVKLSQIESATDITKYRNELKASQAELALLQKWLELLNSGVDPKSIDFEQLKLDVIENAQSAQDSFEDQFLDLEEIVNINEGTMAVSNRLGKQFFSPNLHPDIFKDKESLESQLRLNATMSEPELAGSVFTDIFPKTLKQLLKSSELNQGQITAINQLLELYNLYIEKGNLSDDQLVAVLTLIKSDENLKLIFRQSPELKPLLNTTLKEIILDIGLPEGKSVNELKEIIIRKKSEIAFLQKQLEVVGEISTKECQSKILDINEQHFQKIQELKAQIEKLNLEIRDKIQSMNLQDQQVAKDFLEAAKSSLEDAYVNSAESGEPDIGAIVIKQARAEIMINRFETEQKEYKDKLIKLPNLLFERLFKEGKIGILSIVPFLIGQSDPEFIWTIGDKLTIYRDELSLENKSTYDLNIKLKTNRGLVQLEINELQFITKNFDADRCSYKDAFNNIKTILKRDFEINIDNLEGNNQIAETPKNAFESQEQLAREKYKQIQDIVRKLI